MHRQASSAKNRPTWYRGAGMMLLGLCVLIFVAPIWAIKGTFSFFFPDPKDPPSLADDEHIDRIDFKVVTATPMQDTQDEAIEKTRALVDASAWVELAVLMQQWDQHRTTCAGGESLAELALNTVLDRVSSGYIKASYCQYVKTAIIDDDITKKLEDLAAIHSDKYAFVVLAAHARMTQGWAARGPEYTHNVSESGWATMEQRFEKATWLLSRADPVALNSPLLACAHFELLSFIPDADKKLDDAYHTWSSLDPRNQTPHRQYGYKLLPRWYGSSQRLHIVAQKASLRTQKETGAAAYASMYLEPLRSGDFVLLDMDTQLFHQGILDLADVGYNDPVALAGLIQTLLDVVRCASGQPTGLSEQQTALWEQHTKDLARTYTGLVCKRLTAIRPFAWHNGRRGALMHITWACKQAFDDGATFKLSDNGLETFMPRGRPQ
jgi:hypothetical protein